MQQQETERRVLLVIDTATRRIVSTRPLRANTNADVLLAEYMSYQQAVQAEIARGQPPPPTDPFVLRTHGETNEAGGRFMYVELADAPGRVPPPAAAVDTDDKNASPSRGRRRSSGSRRSSSPSPQSSPTRGSGSSSPTGRASAFCRTSSSSKQPAARSARSGSKSGVGAAAQPPPQSMPPLPQQPHAPQPHPSHIMPHVPVGSLQPPPPQGFFAANFQSLFGWARPPQSAPRSYAPAPYAAHANALATTLAEHQYAQQYYGVHPSHTAQQQQRQQQLFNKGGGVAAQAQQQPPPVELPPAWLRGMSATGDAGIQYLAPGQPRAYAGLRVAIALMTRKPHHFDWWLRYHLSLGVCHVFVHVEDTPELLPLLASAEFAPFVTVTHVSAHDAQKDAANGNYYTLMQRQEAQVRRSLDACPRHGIDWLFHIDDDELLHLEVPLAQLVQEAGPGCACIVLQNVEGIPRRPDYDNIFEEIDLFCLDIHSLLAYANGKAAGRCGFCTWLGPHRFTGTSVIVDADQAALLHFESCTYEMWRNKFSKHRHMEASKRVDIEKIPFPFYRDSIKLFQNDATGGDNEARWREFFQQRKIKHFDRVPAADKFRLKVSPRPPNMITF